MDVQVDLNEAKKIVGERTSISGNVDTSNLVFITPEEIYQEACNCIEMEYIPKGLTMYNEVLFIDRARLAV